MKQKQVTDPLKQVEFAESMKKIFIDLYEKGKREGFTVTMGPHGSIIVTKPTNEETMSSI